MSPTAILGSEKYLIQTRKTALQTEKQQLCLAFRVYLDCVDLGNTYSPGPAWLPWLAWVVLCLLLLLHLSAWDVLAKRWNSKTTQADRITKSQSSRCSAHETGQKKKEKGTVSWTVILYQLLGAPRHHEEASGEIKLSCLWRIRRCGWPSELQHRQDRAACLCSFSLGGRRLAATQLSLAAIKGALSYLVMGKRWEHLKSTKGRRRRKKTIGSATLI